MPVTISIRLILAWVLIGGLLTTRVGRGSSYYGADELFSRHYGIVDMLIKGAGPIASLDPVDPWPIPNFITMFGLTLLVATNGA